MSTTWMGSKVMGTSRRSEMVWRVWGTIVIVGSTVLGSGTPSWGSEDRDEVDRAIPESVTYYEHVAAILNTHCLECHRPGEAGPFAFTTYDEARKRGRMILEVTQSGYMPPWHPDSTYLPLRDRRGLSEHELDLIDAWVDSGMPAGDPAQAPAPPEFAEGWRLGTPDIVVTMPEAFEVPADGPDVYRNLVLPLDFPEDAWVRAVEIRPSARAVVHHSIFLLGDSESVRKMDGQDGQPGFDGMPFGLWLRGALGGWAVGATPRYLPDGLALRLPAHTDLVLQTHFHPSGKLERERTTIGIHLADGPPQQPMGYLQIPPLFGRFHIGTIRAGDDDHTIQASRTIDKPIDLIGVGAHAHYLATDIRAEATLPDGSTLKLFRIPQWDFNWQGRYEYEDPIRLPAGTQIDVSIVYDNSAGNIANPTHPPVDVRYGRQSTDEMGAVTFTYVPANGRRDGLLSGGRLGLFGGGFRNGVAPRRAPRQLPQGDDDAGDRD